MYIALSYVLRWLGSMYLCVIVLSIKRIIYYDLCFVLVFLILLCLSGTHSPFFTFSVRAVITPVCLLGLAVVLPTDTNT